MTGQAYIGAITRRFRLRRAADVLGGRRSQAAADSPNYFRHVDIEDGKLTRPFTD